MSGRGVLFAIDDEVLARLGDASDDAQIRAIVAELEAQWDEPHVCELDRAWDAIHRMLTDGRLTFDSGKPPLSWAILGGTRLHEGEAAIVTVKTADQTAAIARALRGWQRGVLRQAYHRLPRHDYGDLDEEDFEYVWLWFERMLEFWADAAREERAVVFAVEP